MSETELMPNNKEFFKRLIVFAKEIISLCKQAGTIPVIYGSFAQFYHTENRGMTINDIDLWVPESSYPEIISMLQNEGIDHEYVSQWHTLIVSDSDLKVEIDSLDHYYTGLDRKPFPREFDRIDFYGEAVDLLTLENLEKFYEVALHNSDSTSEKVKERIKHLERFLGRELYWKD